MKCRANERFVKSVHTPAVVMNTLDDGSVILELSQLASNLVECAVVHAL